MTTPVSLTSAADLSWREQKKRLTRSALHMSALRLVLDSGLSAVTVDEICGAVGVSSRTFFNYFPSKAAAALGLPDLRIDDERRNAFLSNRGGNLVDDLCDLVADVLASGGNRLSDRQAMHDVLNRRPELKPELFHWLADVRRQFIEVAEERTSPERARPAVTLVMAALTDTIEQNEAVREQLGLRLRSCVTRMCEVAADGRQIGRAVGPAGFEPTTSTV